MDCKINIKATWSENCIISKGAAATFEVTDARTSIPIVIQLKTIKSFKTIKIMTEAMFLESNKLVSIFKSRTTLFNFEQNMFRE